MSKAGIAAALLALALATACSGSANNSAKSASTAGRAPAASAAPAQAAATVLPGAVRAAADTSNGNAALAPRPAAGQSGAAAPGGGVADPNASAASSFDRKIIRNADLGIVVEDVQAAAGSVSSIATGLGGYVASSNLTQSGEKLRGTISVRVPADKFDQAFSQFERLGLKVQRENVSSQDVTEEYADLDARIKNLEATADQLRQLLSTVREKTNDTNQILNVYRELTTITGQIETAKGRQLYLGKLSELATLSVELIPQGAPAPASKHTSWSAARTLRDAATVLGGAGQVAVAVLIWAVVFVLPLALALTLIAALALLLGRRLRILRRAPGAGAGAP